MARKTKAQKEENERQIDMMLFFVLARMFPKLSDTEILDYIPEVKDVIKEFVNGA